MTLTYIFHSGFMLETDEVILVFDCWHDPSDVIAKVLNDEKPMYVFASHFHEDHFCRDIFKWRQRNAPTTYILSKDILRRRRAESSEADVWMGKGAVWNDEHVSVTATGSNDSGVSWIVETGGKRFFHAGDLNNWYARFLADDTPDAVIHSIEFDEDVNPVAEEKRFLGELKDIAKKTGSFDIAMFPVDGRIGNGYTRGARQFIERFEVKLFVPMHFVASGYESAWRMEPFCAEKNIPFWPISKIGDSICIG